MRSPFALTTGLAAGLVIGLFARSPQTASRHTNQMLDAAFRDGMFQASLDVGSGRKPHLASGRWNTNADRVTFIVGYEQAYQEAAGTRNGKSPKADAAEVAGYLDGMADGASDGASSRSFRSEKTSSYLTARQDSLPSGTDVARFQQEYRDAYMNGYQQGYYTNQNASVWSYYSQ